jgi:hypothetical protein
MLSQRQTRVNRLIGGSATLCGELSMRYALQLGSAPAAAGAMPKNKCGFAA